MSSVFISWLLMLCKFCLVFLTLVLALCKKENIVISLSIFVTTELVRMSESSEKWGMRFPFVELMNLSNLMNLMKSYQNIISNWMCGKYHWYLFMITTVKFTFHLCCLFIQMCTFSFFIISLLINYNYLTSFYSSHVPDKFIKFNEFNKILKRENLIVPIQFYFLHVVLT